MTIKSLLFCLFLYIALAWVGAAYFYSGSTADILHYGLLWTAIGLIVVLVSIIGSKLVGWWRIRRARSAAQPKTPAKPSTPVDPDEEALIALIAEANSALAKSPAFADKRGAPPLTTLPWYLLVGPEGTGKTSTMINSGLEPILLAGQVAGSVPIVPTRLCNLWMAKGAIFAEFGGRVFGGEIGRWSQLLRILRGSAPVPLWRRVWGEPVRQVDLRGVIAFCNATEFTAGSSDPQRLERSGRDWQERLGAIAEAFGLDIPVYLAITKCDKIRYFPEFFRRLPDPEAGQVLGSFLPFRERASTDSGEVFVEAEAKRLTSSFRLLYHALAERRLTQLAHEPDPTQRPAIYEFPRELKRIRSPLVQFLTDAFRPRSLGPKPVLRGYYLTAVRQVEAAAPDLGATRSAESTDNPMEATRLFRGDATQLFHGDDLTKVGGGRRNGGMAWMFSTDLFHKVVLRDRPPRNVPAVSGNLDRLHIWTFRAVAAVCALLCFAFVLSWVRNRELLSDVAAVPLAATRARGPIANLGDLEALDKLRQQIVRLEESVPLSMRWGLYSGDRVLPAARHAYFQRFHDLLLIDLNSVMIADLEALPPSPAAGAPYDPAYRTLKAHLMISAQGCPVDPAFLSRSLKDVRPRIAPNAAAEWQALADRQIEFYANEAKYGELPRLPGDAAGREHARDYLRKLKGGIEQLYASLLGAAEKSVPKTQRLEDLASNYTKVLAGPEPVSPVYSPAGWALVEKASKESSAPAAGDPCVTGESTGAVGAWKQNAQTAEALQRMFFRDYAEHWRKYVDGFSVIRFASPDDAARKLDLLSDHSSPLLALLFLTANQTNFPAPAAAPETLVEKLPGVKQIVGSAKKAEGQAKAVLNARPQGSDVFNSPADVTRSFQPVHWVEPPGSDKWVGERTAAYVDALGLLRRSMQDIAQSGTKDPAVHQTAIQNYDKALETVRQIVNGFSSIGVGALDGTVQHLLEAPIKLTNPFIVRDMDRAGLEKINRELRSFCQTERSTFSKYPFQLTSTDASLDEFASVFDPAKGLLWKFKEQSLADLVIKEGSLWKAKDPAKKPLVTAEMLAFLNRAQQIRDAFYAPAATQLGFSYNLRPKLDSRLKDFTLALRIDGVQFEWTSALRHQFTWPALPGTKDPGAVASLKTGATDLPFVSQGGVWGIFRVLGEAEPRDIGAREVEWKYSSRGRREPMGVPVQLEIVEFPNGVDIFNPRFWQDFRCPAVAVQ